MAGRCFIVKSGGYRNRTGVRINCKETASVIVQAVGDGGAHIGIGCQSRHPHGGTDNRILCYRVGGHIAVGWANDEVVVDIGDIDGEVIRVCAAIGAGGQYRDGVAGSLFHSQERRLP